MSEPPDPESGKGKPDPPGLMGRVVRGAAFSAGGYALAQALNLVVYIVLARLLVPSEFGTYAAATVLLGFALLATETGMVAALVQRRDRFEEAASTTVVTNLLSGVFFGLLSLASAPLLGAIFDSSQVTEVTAVMSGIILLQVISAAPEAVLQRRLSFLRRVVIEPTQVIVFGAVAIVCAEGGLGVWALVVGQYAAVFTDSVLTWILARWRPRLHLASLALWRELVAYGRHIFQSTVIYNLPQQVDALIIGPIFGTAALGQFRYGFRLASTPFQALLAAAAYVLFPAFARISHDHDRLLPAFIRSLRWTSIVAFPTGFLLLPLGVPLAVILFGEIWREAGYAAAAMSAYTAAGMVISIVSEGIKAEGRPEPLTKMHAVTAGFSIGLMLALAPLGFRAAAAALSIGAIAGAGYSLVVAHRVLGLAPRTTLAELWPPAISAALLVAALFGLEALLDADGHSAVIAGLLLTGEAAVGLGLYAIVLAMISRRMGDELRWAARIGISRLRRRPAGGIH